MNQTRLCVNRFGKYYNNGQAYPKVMREHVLDMYHNGISQRAISLEVGASRCFVQNVLADYDRTGTACPSLKKWPERQVLTPEVIECIEIEKLMKPSMYISELQERLILDGVVNIADVPCKSTVSKCTKEDLNMTKKKIQQVPAESLRNENIDLRNQFLDDISNLNAGNIHCFDESSVIKTTSNRRYGNAPCGQPAFEIQRYASNATHTINLLHSPFGVDFVNVIDGPSNGQELLLFFEEAINLTRADGSAVLERGDTVIMDNCGFHHGNFVEPVLTAMLNTYGVNLLFQPPYSPEFNTCELCFNQIKDFLRRNQRLAEEETAYAIYEGCEKITQENSMSYFQRCGYLF